MNKLIINKIHLLLLALVLFIAACKSTKQVAVVITPPVKISQVDSVFALMKNAEYKYEWLTGKFSGIYKVDESEQNFSGQFRIRKDSLIWCSLTVMNFEVARITVTPDSIKLLNRIDKTYFVSNVGFINDKLNTDVDFDMLQALLVGNDIPYYETDKFDLQSNNTEYVLNTVGRRKIKKYIKNDEDLTKVLIQRIVTDKVNNRILSQNLKQPKNLNKKMTATYSDFQDVSGLMPASVEFEFVGVKNIKLTFKFTKIIKDKPTVFPFTVPAKYTKTN